jgi:hypothetical protein
MRAVYVLLALLLVVDWRQSLVIALPGGWRETWNPVLRWLGDRFGAPGVHFWFALVALALGAALYLVAAWRLEVLVVAIAIELAATMNNFYNGVQP